MGMQLMKKIGKHIWLVSKHKWLVFKYSIKLGIPFRGLVHDISKFSLEELGESIKYYDGKISPITGCKKDKGYSRAWLHHKGRNKHHEWYWVDLNTPDVAPVIPYKYVAEMICDKLSAGKIYKGSEWKQSSQYEYWSEERKKLIMNPKVDNLITEVFLQVRDNGIERTITKKNIKSLYIFYS